MANEKKERKMTPKGFLAKANSPAAAASAIGFLKQYREYLTTGELKDATSPIIAKFDAGELPASPALKEIQYAVMTHIIKSDADKLDQKESGSGGGGGGTRKPWRCTIFDAAGNVQTRITTKGEEEELIKGFDLSSDADRWADRRLFEGTHGWYAIVEHTVMNVKTRIERGDSMARILKKPKGPTVQVKGKSTKTLGFGVKAKQTRVTFSGS